MPTKIKAKLPNEIIALPNADKAFHEKWHPKRNLLNIPHPFRCVLMGRPNVGKTTIIKNIILRANPAFKEIFVIHCDAEYTKEYDDLGAKMLSEIPAPEEWEGKNKTMVVIDDVEIKMMDKRQRRNLDRLFGYVSTHKNISVILTAQDPFNIVPIVRRCSNLWVLWRGIDLDAMNSISRKAGLQSHQLKTIFDELMPNQKDSLWIDLTDRSPAPMRKNGYEVITQNTSDSSSDSD